MSSGLVLLLAFGIGVVAGLRSITAPAVVSWAAYLGWINLSGSRLAFMASIWTVALFTFGAFVEYVADQLPSSPPRTAAPALTARICMGLLTGACLGIAVGASPWTAAALGAIGAIAGAFGGYQVRVRLVRGLRVPDAAIAIPEDLVAILVGFMMVSRFRR